MGTEDTKKHRVTVSWIGNNGEVAIDDTIKDTISGTINEPISNAIPETGHLTADEQHVLDLIRNNSKRYTKQDLAKAIGKSVSTVGRIIMILTEKGLIVRVGSNKIGHWEVRE